MIIRETQLSVKYDNKREYDHGLVNYDYENREYDDEYDKYNQ